MTYGRVHKANRVQTPHGAVVSHSAELVRGDSFAREVRPPHPPLRGTFSPRGEGPARRDYSDHHCRNHEPQLFSSISTKAYSKALALMTLWCTPALRV